MRWRSGELSHGRIAMLDLSFKFNMSHRGQFFLRVEFNKGCVWETYNIVRLRYRGRVYSRAIGGLAGLLM